MRQYRRRFQETKLILRGIGWGRGQTGDVTLEQSFLSPGYVTNVFLGTKGSASRFDSSVSEAGESWKFRVLNESLHRVDR
jgi:hypothetical protein